MVADEHRWHARLVNWARWSHDPLGTGYELSRALRDPAPGETTDDADAATVERLLLILKTSRLPLYRAIWQAYMMRRDDVTAAEVLRIPVDAYVDRLAAAQRALDLYERLR